MFYGRSHSKFSRKVGHEHVAAFIIEIALCEPVFDARKSELRFGAWSNIWLPKARKGLRDLGE